MGSTIIETLTSVGEWFVGLFNQLMALFWVEETGTGADAVAGHLTFVGYLSVFAIGIGLTYGLIRLVRGFIRMRG